MTHAKNHYASPENTCIMQARITTPAAIFLQNNGFQL